MAADWPEKGQTMTHAAARRPVVETQMEAVLKCFEANDFQDALRYFRNAPGFTAECALYIYMHAGKEPMLRFLRWVARHSPE